MHTLYVVVALSFVIPIAAVAQAPRALVARAVDAMGGKQAVRGHAIAVETWNSATFAIGQEETPFGQARATFASGRNATDVRGMRRAQSIETRLGTGVSRTRRIIADGIGMIETNGVQAVDGDVAGVMSVIRRRPERLLVTALDQPQALTAVPARTWRGEVMDGVRYALGPDTMSLYFDRPTGLLTVTEVVVDDGVQGDRRIATWFTRWVRGAQVKLPRQIDVEVNGRLQNHQLITSIMENPAGADTFFAIPDSMVQRARAAAPPVAGASASRLVAVAPGVWRAEGNNHFSLVVEQASGLLVVEAPLGSARSREVLDTLRARFPNKPVQGVINTHHHWDHSGGLREYMARGIPVITHARNAEFIRGIARARKTVAPDALSRRPTAPRVTSVADSLVLGAGDGRVVVYQLPSTHGEGILAAYVPASRLLFISDVLSPTPTMPAAASREVVEFARRRGLSVDRVVGGHAGIAPWADVERAAGP